MTQQTQQSMVKIHFAGIVHPPEVAQISYSPLWSWIIEDENGTILDYTIDGFSDPKHTPREASLNALAAALEWLAFEMEHPDVIQILSEDKFLTDVVCDRRRPPRRLADLAMDARFYIMEMLHGHQVSFESIPAGENRARALLWKNGEKIVWPLQN